MPEVQYQANIYRYLVYEYRVLRVGYIECALET